MFKLCFAALFFISSTFAAQDPSSMMGMGFNVPQKTVFSYANISNPKKNPSDTEQHKVNVLVPLYKGENDSVSLSVRLGSLHFGERETLSGTGTPVPVDLWNAEIGGQYTHKLSNERFWGSRFTFGSASDHPFSKLNTTTFSLAGYYGYPGSNENRRWIISVFLSNNNPILDYIPIPGIAYVYKTKVFSGMLGIPFASIYWNPVEIMSFALMIFGPTINAEIACGNIRKLQGFIGFNWSQQMYLRSERANGKDHMYLNEKKALIGIRFFLFEVQSGYAFSRSLYEGPRFTNRSGGSVELGNSLFLLWNIRLAI